MCCHEVDRSLERSRGITLVELIMSMAIAASVLALALETFSSLYGVLQGAQRVTDCQLEQNGAFAEIESDLRSAGADPLAAGLYQGGIYRVDIVPADQPLAGGLRVHTDRTGPQGAPDGDLEDAGEMVVYRLDPETGVVNRWASTGTGELEPTPVLTGTLEFESQLLDRNGAAADPASAVQVRVSFATEVEPGGSASTGSIRRQQLTIVLPNATLVEAGS